MEPNDRPKFEYPYKKTVQIKRGQKGAETRAAMLRKDKITLPPAPCDNEENDNE